MTEKSLILEKSGNIAKIIFNRPNDFNAFNKDMARRLEEAVIELGNSKDIRAVIITGAGDKAFMSGTDVKELGERTVVNNIDTVAYRHSIFYHIENLKIPTIAAINGYAFGGGCEISMLCTFRFAAQEAKMGQLEVNLGLMPGGGGTQRLGRLVGKSTAAELLLTGKMISAEEALKIGLVNKVFPRKDLMEECEKFAQVIAEKSPIAVKMILNALNKGLQTDLYTGLMIELLSTSVCLSSEDYKEGLAALFEKRKPTFTGK